MGMSKSGFTPQIVHYIAQLANVPVTSAEETTLGEAFSDTIDVVAKMAELDTATVQPTHQVTGLENVMREDVIDETRMFTQEQALANAAKTYAGFFVVPQVIEQQE